MCDSACESILAFSAMTIVKNIFLGHWCQISPSNQNFIPQNKNTPYHKLTSMPDYLPLFLIASSAANTDRGFYKGFLVVAINHVRLQQHLPMLQYHFIVLIHHFNNAINTTINQTTQDSKGVNRKLTLY